MEGDLGTAIDPVCLGGLRAALAALEAGTYAPDPPEAPIRAAAA